VATLLHFFSPYPLSHIKPVTKIIFVVTMPDQKLTGAKAALLAEYKKAIDELIVVISPITTEQLLKTIEPKSANPDCTSIQTILTHVTAAVFSYAVYIENASGLKTERPERLSFTEISPYISQLNAGFVYNENLFVQQPGITLEEFNSNKKIHTRWGQEYDVEQMLEHAIVHVLRHRRQIEHALIKL